MSMKPRLNDGPETFQGTVTQPKRISETAPLTDPNLATKSKYVDHEVLRSTQWPVPHKGED